MWVELGRVVFSEANVEAVWKHPIFKNRRGKYYFIELFEHAAFTF